MSKTKAKPKATEKAPDKSRTHYRVKVRCQNCAKKYVAEIKKGVAVDMHACDGCGVEELERKAAL